MVTSGFVEEPVHLRAELRSVTTTSGAQCVTINFSVVMQWWPADSLDLVKQVGSNVYNIATYYILCVCRQNTSRISNSHPTWLECT